MPDASTPHVARQRPMTVGGTRSATACTTDRPSSTPQLSKSSLWSLTAGRLPKRLLGATSEAAVEKEPFAVAMRHNAMEFTTCSSAFDLDENRSLNFAEFSQLVREREAGIHSEVMLGYRFMELDPRSTGEIGIRQYFCQSLRDAFCRSGSHAAELFAAWDEDGDGSISKSEFRSVARAMGFQISPVEMNAIFEEFDFVVKDGTLSYAEVSQQLMKASPLPEKPLERALAINSRRQHALRRDTDLQNKIELQELQVARATSSPEEPGKPSHPEDMVDQLRVCLTANLARVIDLFRVWDEDSSGTIEKKEFRGALRSIGIKASRTALDLLFDRFDSDRSGTIDYHELNKRLRRRADLDDKLRVGGAGKLDLKASNKLGIRHEASTAPKTLHGTIFDTTSARPVVQQLIDALQKAKARVSTLFYEWDKSGDGFISRDEMASALQDLGVSDGADLRAAVDGLFRSLDWNQSGSIDLHELFAGLKAQRAAAKHALADERNYHSLRTRQRTVVAPHERAVAVWDPQTSCFRACGNTPQARPTTAEAITRKHAMRRRTFAPRFERQPTLPRAPARPRTAQAVVALSTAASMPAMNHTRSPVGTSDALHSCAAQTSELVAEDKATQACMVEDESQTRRLRALAPAMLHGSQSEPVLSVKGAAAKDAVLTACLPHAAGSQRRYKDAIGNAAARAPLPEASAASTHSRLRHRQVLAMAKPKTPALQFHRAVSAPFVHRPNSLAGLRREAAKDTEWFGTALKCGILPKRVEDT